MDPAYEMAETLKSEISIDGKTTKQLFPRRDQFAAELDYFSACVLNHEEPRALRSRRSCRCPHHSSFAAIGATPIDRLRSGQPKSPVGPP